MKGNLSKAPEHYGTVPTKLSELENDKDFTTKSYIDGLVGDIDAALDNILAIQNALISQSVNLAKDGDL